MSEPMHATYLPFSEDQLREHFAPVGGESEASRERHLRYYRNSLDQLSQLEHQTQSPKGPTRAAVRRARQIEKDERFWVVAALMGVFHQAGDRTDRVADLLSTAFGETPPIDEFATWSDCLGQRLRLFFEVNLPSPTRYREWLRNNVKDRALIPYMQEAAAAPGTRLEGQTHVDAVLISEDTGFAVLFEAKVLSDADSKVSFDVMRNQLARNIDVMLEENPNLQEPLKRRKPHRSCFVLLTPQVFKDHPHSRLYGWLLPEYQRDPAALARDLPHREGEVDWQALSQRVGWLTFTDCERVAPGSCAWLT